MDDKVIHYTGVNLQNVSFDVGAVLFNKLIPPPPKKKRGKKNVYIYIYIYI